MSKGTAVRTWHSQHSNQVEVNSYVMGFLPYTKLFPPYSFYSTALTPHIPYLITIPLTSGRGQWAIVADHLPIV